MEDFHQISISGRYIYCYLCLINVIKSERLEPIPEFADIILQRFPSSSRLDEWQSEADEIMPSLIMDLDVDTDHYKILSYNQILDLRIYYSKSKLLENVLENLIWLGISNLYCGFNSEYTFVYVMDTIKLMKDSYIELPNFSKINSCSVNEKGGWGNLVSMVSFL